MKKVFLLFCIYFSICKAYADTVCANLPSAYTQVEYIESTGTQYIDAGQNFLFGDEFYFDYMKMSNSVSVENKGYGTSGGSINIASGGRTVNNIIQMWVTGIGNTAYTPSLSAADALQKRYIENWEITSGKLNSTLTEVGTSNVYSLTVNNSIFSSSFNSNIGVCLFRDRDSNYAHPSAMRVYLTWLKRSNGNYAFYLIPAKRNSDNVVGMYDTVSGSFLTNGGSGSFTAGSAVCNEYDITYSCGTGGGNAPTTNTTATLNESFTPATNTCAVPNGYSFSGWLIGGTNTVVNNAFTWAYNEDKTLTAQYSPNTININWWNGDTQLSVQNTAQSCTYGGTLAVPSQPTKPGYTFNGWKIMRVPRGFTELEYIESSGTQYIDTGFSAPNGFKAKVGLYFTTISPLFIMGAHGDVDPWGRNYFRIQNSASRLLFEVGAGDCWVSSYVVQPNTKYDIEFSTVKNNIFLNGDTLTHGWGDGDDTRSPYSIYLFAVHGYQGGKDKASMSGQMYYAKIYDENNVMVRQFIPARRNSDNVLGMWDTVTQTFFTNAGSGNFIAGPNAQ